MSFKSEAEWQAYLAFHSGKKGERPRILAVEEATAYGYEIEALNLLLGNRLRDSSIQSLTDLQSAIYIPKKDLGTMSLILTLASHYYPEGMNGNNYSQRFMDFIIKVYKEYGYAVYVEYTNVGLRRV